MEFYQLKYFQTLCLYKSFAKTAEVLYVTPSAVTTAIKKLETELGTQLIVREPNYFKLTEQGEKLLSCSNDIQTSLMKFKMSLENDMKNNEIRIAILPKLASSSLLENIETFSEIYPDINVTVKQTIGSNIRGYLEDGSVDFCIVQNQILGRYYFAYEEYEETEYGIFIPEDHPWSRLKVISPTLLKESSAGLLNYHSRVKQSPDNYFYLNGVTLSPNIFTCWDLNNILRSVSMHMGIALLPRSNEGSYPGVVFRPLDPPMLSKHYFVWHKNTPPTQATRELMQYLKSKASLS